jgi:succinate dehydrogenase / fumarate reductase flavoprotein subunit
MLAVKGQRTVDDIHKELGNIMWNHVGMSRNAEGLKTAVGQIQKLRQSFWNDVKVSGENNFKNSELEKAGRLADFLELGELMAADALQREESCGGHFREEHQTPDNEAKRNDEKFCHVSAWQFGGTTESPRWNEHKEPLNFEYVHPSQRSYK